MEKKVETRIVNGVTRRIEVIRETWSRMSRTKKIALGVYGGFVAASFLLDTYHDGREELMQFRNVNINSRDPLDKLQARELTVTAHGCRKNAFENFIHATVFPVTWVTRIAPRAVLLFNPRNVENKN
jgi:hypothetical protein